MRSIPYPIKFLPLEGWKVKDVLFLLSLVPTQSGVLKQQLALSVAQILRLYLERNIGYGVG